MPFCNLFFQLQIILFADRNGADCKHGVESIHALTFQTVIGITHGLLVKMFQNVLHDLGDTLLRCQRFFGVNRTNLFILIAVFLFDGVDIVNAERQDISIVDRIHDGIGMEFRPKSLLRGSQFRIAASSGVDSKNRSSGKSENMVILKVLDDVGVHLPKLAAVALVKHKNNVLVINRMGFVLRNEHIQFLNGRYDNSGSAVLKLSLQDCGALVSVGGTFFKAIIFLDGLVVQILTVNYKQNLVDIRQSCGKLRCLKGSQRFAASCGVPDISSSFDGTCFLVIGRYLDPVQNTFGCHNLIRSHDKQ